MMKAAPIAFLLRAPLVCLTIPDAMQGHRSWMPRYDEALSAITHGIRVPVTSSQSVKRGELPYPMCDGIIRPSSIRISAH